MCSVKTTSERFGLEPVPYKHWVVGETYYVVVEKDLIMSTTITAAIIKAFANEADRGFLRHHFASIPAAERYHAWNYGCEVPISKIVYIR